MYISKDYQYYQNIEFVLIKTANILVPKVRAKYRKIFV